jgi:hypothetical protein
MPQSILIVCFYGLADMESQRSIKRSSPQYRHAPSAATAASLRGDLPYAAASKCATYDDDLPWRARGDADYYESMSEDSFVGSPSACSESGLSALAELAGLADAQRDLLLNLPETIQSPGRSQSPRPLSLGGHAKDGPQGQRGLLVRSVSIPLQGNAPVGRPTLSKPLLSCPSRPSAADPAQPLASVEQVPMPGPTFPVMAQYLSQIPASSVEVQTDHQRRAGGETIDLPSEKRQGEPTLGPLWTCQGPSVFQPLWNEDVSLGNFQSSVGGPGQDMQAPGNDSAVADQSNALEVPTLSTTLTELLATQCAAFGTVINPALLNPAVMLHLMATNASILRKYDGTLMSMLSMSSDYTPL